MNVLSGENIAIAIFSEGTKKPNLRDIPQTGFFAQRHSSNIYIYVERRVPIVTGHSSREGGGEGGVYCGLKIQCGGSGSHFSC